MAPARADRHPLSRAYRLLFTRGAHLIVGALAVAFCVNAVIDATKERPSDGAVWQLGRPDLVILDVPIRQDTPTSDLRPRDRVVGIARHIVRTPQEAASILRAQQIGSTVTYLVERTSGSAQIEVPMIPFRAVDRTYIYNILVALAFLLIGFAVYLKSQNDEPSRLFFLLCLLFTVFFTTIQSRTNYFWSDLLNQNVGAFARFFLPALFLHFFLVFPEKKPTMTRYPFLGPLLYLVPVMFYVAFTKDQFFGERGASISLTDWLVLGLYFTIGLAALLHSYFNYNNPLQKERVRILTFGTLTAVVPFLAFKIGLEELITNRELHLIGLLPMLAIPVSFGYCIARYRIMQVEVLLKSSLRYSLLTGLILLAYLFLVLGLGGLVLELAGPTTQIVSVGATLGIALVLWPMRSRVQGLVDRRFFRARDDLGTALQEFSKEIPRLIQRDALLDRVGSRLCHILELPYLGVYLRGSRGGVVAWRKAGQIRPAGEPIAPPSQRGQPPLPEEIHLSAIIKIIERRNEPFWIDLSRTGRTIAQRAITREQAELALRHEEQEHLARHGIALLVPLATQGRLIGLFALPDKPTGESYRLQELELLTIVAGQMALQIENSRLYEEEVAKQKLEEEMAMARTIQSRLLPNTLPSVPGIQLDAVNISSRQVSGDYYDVIVKEDGCLGLVISDVSGKGMPASLLASSLQAALRAQCDTGASPSTILARVNRQLHASTDPQHFATLFLGIFDPRQRTLAYSSGGHNSPILLRRNGRIELLEKGGLPLGAFDFGQYEEETIVLEPGDLLCMYTDGLTESKNLDDEEFGTARVEQLLLQHREMPVGHLIGRLHEEVMAFSGHEEADDDITMVLMRVTEHEAKSLRAPPAAHVAKAEDAGESLSQDRAPGAAPPAAAKTDARRETYGA
jgi:sigma-B regulation protein RsbU (phosphoserine phosphatase)